MAAGVARQGEGDDDGDGGRDNVFVGRLPWHYRPRCKVTSDDKRSADATIKGFLAQALRTIELWLALADGDQIVCEGIEDADVITSAETLLHQFKELADAQSQYDMRGVIAHFARTFANKIGSSERVRFVFVTPAPIFEGVSKKAKAETLLRDWPTLPSQDLADQLKKLFAEWDPAPKKHKTLKGEFVDAAAIIEKAGGWKDFQERVTWQFAAPNFESVELALTDRLRADNRVGGLAEPALATLLHEVLRVSSHEAKGERVLTRASLDAALSGLAKATGDYWTARLLEDIERPAYEAELARGRRKIARLLAKHMHLVPRAPLLEQLRSDLVRTKRLLLIGRRGVGKSHLAAFLLATENRVIWLEAGDLGRTDKQANEQLSQALRVRLTSDGGTLVIDGLESADANQLEALESIATDCANVQLVGTVRALSHALNQDIALALPGAEQVPIPPLEEAELDDLCSKEGVPPPAARSRPVLRAPFFFWLSRTLKPSGEALSTEREYLAQFWSQRNVGGEDEPCLIGLSEFCLRTRLREAVVAPEHIAAAARLVKSGVLIYDRKNEQVISFQHDVFRDYAIARHVLQRFHPQSALVDWLRTVDIVQRSWALPCIEFEAERRFAQDRVSYWDIACALVDVDTVMDWLIPARAATEEQVEELIARIAVGDVRAADVFQRLEQRASAA